MPPVTPTTTMDAARLVQDHQVGVWRYLRAIGCDRELALDLTQETFLAVLQRPIVEYAPAATAAYLRRVARNLFITHCRRRRMTMAAVDVDAIDADWSRWAGHDQGEALLAALRGCLERASDRVRLAFRLRYTDQKSRVEIAESLGLSESGAKNLMQRAKSALRQCIERKLRQS